ncbi:hypothetical protein [Aeromicrobium marinum]|nr:hypothetical protein [Aeromicrobium marinum]
MPRWICFVPVLVGGVAYGIFGHPTLPIVQFELAGDALTAAELAAGREDEFRAALVVDWVAFIPGYVLTAVLLSTRLGRRGLAGLLVVAAVAAGLFDVVENARLWSGLEDGTDAAFQQARAFALAKFGLLTVVLALGVVAVARRRPANLSP